MIRPATADDRDAIAALELVCFRAEAWPAVSVAAELGATNRRIFVSCEGPDVAAYGVLMLGPDVADILRMAVHSSFRRRRRLGVGLVARLIAEAESAGYGRILLEVAAANDAALRLYRGSGFVEISRRSGYYGGGRDALILECAIG